MLAGSDFDAIGVPDPEPSLGNLGDLPSFGEFVDFIGLPEVREAEQRYAVAETTSTDAAGRRN